MLRIASIGAIEKSDESFRIIHDGIHGIRINNDSRMCDGIRMPGPREESSIIRRASSRSAPFFSIQADVSKAHRRFLYRPLIGVCWPAEHTPTLYGPIESAHSVSALPATGGADLQASSHMCALV